MKPAFTLLATLALAACSLIPSQAPKAVYDLGSAPAKTAVGGPLAWRIADVTAPPWLGTEGIVYRLNFQQAQRLQHYRDSTWAAPPAALLTQRLRQHLHATPGCPGHAPALLTVHLDEFEHAFSSAGTSQAVLRVNATLWPAGGGAAQQQQWRVEQPAAPDAPGAVRAMAQAVDVWLPQLGDWMAASCRR